MGVNSWNTTEVELQKDVGWIYRISLNTCLYSRQNVMQKRPLNRDDASHYRRGRVIKGNCASVLLIRSAHIGDVRLHIEVCQGRGGWVRIPVYRYDMA